MILRILLETLLEPVFYIVMVWLAAKCWFAYRHDFVPPFKD